ncbi:AAA family ATPase [Jiella marina]|uniref:AAA family ATPase n=1 Tax=Jiella sp. LLJ827 TaxID=2917712 RepID=UPI002100E891|nr:hypothetical protein [Jiella sp. LLJ827]MCQ0990236.1 hypothetical protein [Jiella sp. LLJ827]
MSGSVVGRNVMVIGCPGSGKSTLAREIGRALDLRVVHFDQIYWKPGWRPRDSSELPALVAEAIATEGWVFDGNNSRTLALRATRADTLIYIDLPRDICLRRIVKRIALGYGRVRPDMAPGCPERLDWGFLKWVWSFPRHSAPGLETFFREFSGRKIRLASVPELRAFREAVRRSRCHNGGGASDVA